MAIEAIDVLIEILLRLEVKQLCQLKIVSKQWLVVISSPYFKRLYNERSMRSPRLLIVEESDEDHTRSTHGLLSRTLHMSTMDISTGFVRREFSIDVWGRHYSFLSISNLICYNNNGSNRVCDPTTHECVYLPCARFHSKIYGFYLGHLLDSNEYKIVCVFSTSKTFEADPKFHFQILTLKDGGHIPSSWRTIETCIRSWPHNAKSVNIKSSIYWLLFNRVFKEKSIISLDLKSEKFSTISCLEVSSSSVYEQLTEINGQLCLAHFSKKHQAVSMFVLKDQDNHIWVKQCCIDLSDMGGWFTVVGYLPCDNNNGKIIFRCSYGNLLSYNIKDKTFTRLGYIESPKVFHVSFYFDRFFSFSR